MLEERQDSAGGARPEEAAEFKERLFATLYAELRRLADSKLRQYPGMTVSPTTLVHEAYVNLAARDGTSFTDRDKFLSYAARAMRGLLIDFARRRQALKRGAGLEITQLDTQVDAQPADGAQLERLASALDALAKLDPRLAEVVDLKYFCGFSFAEIAALRGISERTVQRDWEKARLILYHQVGEV
ncbi:MAG TPA: ECF-type sigma factor [Steroidobacteraceae bacterium]|nr:ECF-type sigma factor [Steroidobacteraceae bacterium]